MATPGQALEDWQVRRIQIMHDGGASEREISQLLGLAKQTVGKYVYAHKQVKKVKEIEKN